MNLALWFSLGPFAASRRWTELTRCGAFGLASDVAACVAGSELKRRCVEACLELGDSGDHAERGEAPVARPGGSTSGRFSTVKRRYFESTIKRMVAKGQAEAALRHAGDDKDLIRCVIASLASGDASTAAEYVARLGSDLSPVEDFDVGDLLGTETGSPRRRRRGATRTFSCRRVWRRTAGWCGWTTRTVCARRATRCSPPTSSGSTRSEPPIRTPSE